MGRDVVALVVERESAKDDKRHKRDVCTKDKKRNIVWSRLIRRLSHGQ